MCFWSLSSARLLTMMWMVILIITTVAMLATLRFMSTPNVDAGDDAEDYASDHMGVERRASRRAHVARLHCESVEANERVVRKRGTMWYVSLCIASSLSRMKMLLLIVLRAWWRRDPTS